MRKCNFMLAWVTAVLLPSLATADELTCQTVSLTTQMAAVPAEVWAVRGN